MVCTSIFYTLLLASSLPTGHSYLVTRLKNPNEYVAKDDYSDLDDLDDNTYHNLLQELPELKDVLKYRKSNLPNQELDNARDPYENDEDYKEFKDKAESINAILEEYDLSNSTDNSKMQFEKIYKSLLEKVPGLKDVLKNRRSDLPLEFDDADRYEMDQQYKVFDDRAETFNKTLEDFLRDYKENIDSTTGNPNMRFATRWPEPSNITILNNKLNKTRRQFWHDLLSWINPYYGDLVAKCYWCGMNTSGIPINPMCHDVFEGQDSRARRLTRYFRAHCIRNVHHGWHARRKPLLIYSSGIFNRYVTGPGLITEYYGWFTTGCFKRFLDVGTVYTQRGCRSWWPRMNWSPWKSYAARR